MGVVLLGLSLDTRLLMEVDSFPNLLLRSAEGTTRAELVDSASYYYVRYLLSSRRTRPCPSLGVWLWTAAAGHSVPAYLPVPLQYL